MLKDIKYRWGIISLVIVSSIYLIWPTYKFYSLTEDKKNELSESSLERLNKRISLGLDLQGGLYILLETDIPLFVEKLATEKPIELMDAIQKAKQSSKVKGSNFFDEFLNLANEKEMGTRNLFFFICFNKIFINFIYWNTYIFGSCRVYLSLGFEIRLLT